VLNSKENRSVELFRETRWLFQMTEITVVVCTYNRCRSLANTLESLARSEMPTSVDWEILVVDNNSQDQTRAVVEEFYSRFPHRIRYLFEPQAGKSYALNSGVREARGGVLVFTDDDVTVEPVWLQNLTANLRSGEWAGTSGRTLPDQGFSPPVWLSPDERNLAMLGCFDRGLDAFELTEPPLGNNMAYLKKMFERHGGFRVDLGPSPNKEIPRPNEDTEFGLRLLTAGERLRYEPSAVLVHAIPKSRIKKEYFLSWWFDKARADIQVSEIDSQTRWQVAGVPRFFFADLWLGHTDG
jgi:glycosyltransferase involved in cell wall biosynthesis